jgi:hypothetical protein
MAYDALTSLPSVKAWAQISGTNDDATLSQLINAASAQIGELCDRNNLGNVYDYTELYYDRTATRLTARYYFDLTLRHYPVTAVTSVVMGTVPVNVLTLAQLQNYQAGCYLLDDNEPRVLRFQGLVRSDPVTVTYSAGYAPGAIPPALQQAANQFTVEMFRSSKWVGMKSIAANGETTSFDTRDTWGMSKHIMAMLAPYRNVVPFGQR